MVKPKLETIKLEVVNLDSEDYQYALDNIIDYGSEANITFGRAINTIFKIFNSDYLNTENIRRKKEEKVKLLASAMDNFEIPFFPKIYSILAYNGEFVGYEMSANINNVSLDVASDYLSRTEKIEALRKVKDYILFLHNHPLKIIYGDLRDTNILFDESTAEISLCNIDNVSINGSGFEAMGLVQKSFLEHHKGKITPEVDTYMHNVLTRDLIFGCDSLNPLVKKYVRYKPKGYLIDKL